MKSIKENIIAQFAPMFRQADIERKWFYNKYWGLYFSPDELREQFQQGKFLSHPDNWELRAPEKELETLLDLISDYERMINDFHRRYVKWLGEKG